MADNQPADEPAREHDWSSFIWPQLPSELAERIVGYMGRFYIVTTFRQVNKATAERFSGPQHTSIHLSEPVPPHAFAAHWLTPGATRGLTLERRKQLVRLVAASGVLPNLEVALQAAGFTGAACDLPALQLAWLQFGLSLDMYDKAALLSKAASSPTPDWAAKVEWLEAQCCRRSTHVAQCAARLPNDAEALARLTWLQGRGYPMDGHAVQAAANSGNTAALQYLLAEVEAVVARDTGTVVSFAAEAGQLAVLQALKVAGWPVHEYASCCAHEAAMGGHLPVLAWLQEELQERLLDENLFKAAAKSGSVELLVWLRQHGCPWDSKAYTAAAGSGCVAALEWLVEQGCPMEESGGHPYIQACCNGDLAMARCLQRLGVPWGPAGRVFVAAAESGSIPAPLPLLRWLLEEGCPVDSDALETLKEGWGLGRPGWADEVLILLQEHLDRRQP
ncbi:hypothetical protein GPECTOR_47g309 [Gonium pectorale]|uniref:Uncharacterized protein n=1 Tax=Gonium pectorale TaxID=33097 RepID=A0A150G875_GONPE|nr:hypothetical protein GPECTOR_47g309 [Gonium pectorale]|eukprot:KXZ46034.1 hypothetical protein GPECTOR_47g309 [Gonium pectorale]